VTTLFRGRLVIVIERGSQQFRREISDVFYTLQIPVSKTQLFEESMLMLILAMLLIGNNQYSDEDLGKFNARRSCKIIKLPKSFTIQLQRFNFNVKTWTRYKISDNFKFPEEFFTSNFLKIKMNFIVYMELFFI